MPVPARRPRAARVRRRLVAFLTTVLLVTFGTPTQNPALFGPVRFSPARLLAWLTGPPAWADPVWPATPRQRGGTAAGRSHLASAADTRAGRGAGSARGSGTGELPAYQRHTPAARPLRTGGAAGFDKATSQRIASAATANSDLYRNADGSYTRTVSAAPVNYQTADGWRPVDTRLSTGTDGRARAAADRVVTDFAPVATDPALVSLRLSDGPTVGYGLRGAAPVHASVSGSTATYPGVLPATDLMLQAVPGGSKESLVLHSAFAPAEWVFPLLLTGLTARLAAGGAVEFADRSGAVVGRMPRGYLSDARGAEAAVTYALSVENGQTLLRVSVDPAWLGATGRAFPVTMDPTYTSNPGGSTFVLSDKPLDDYSYRTDLRVGTANSGGEIANSFVTFPDVGTALAGHHITAAQLKVFDFYASSCTPTRFDVAAVTQSWPVAGDKSYPGPSFGPSIGNLTADPGAACTNSAMTTTAGTWLTVSLDPATFTSWTTGGKNYGLALYGATTGTSSYKRFDSTNGPYPPQLILTYGTNQAPQIDRLYPPTNDNPTTLTPELIALGHDPDAGPSPVTYDFTVYSAAGAVLADSGQISANNWVVPAGKLAWSQTYYWSVVAYDGADYSPNTSASYFTTTVPQPLITSGLAQNSGEYDFDPSAGNYTTADTDAQVQTVGPALSVHRDYNSLDPRVSQAFGAGWSSVYDMRAANVLNAAGAVSAVVVTYPTGEQVEFGRNPDGTFAPPLGRYAVLTTQPTGYKLVDKSGTTYTFGQTTGASGTYAVSSIADFQGRTETFAYSGGLVGTVTSASGRALHLAWSTPSGATSAHVASVATDPVAPGSPGTALTWAYSYSGDRLTGVCPPTSPTSCTRYSYTNGSHYRTTVIDAGSRDYWRLSEPAGAAVAADQMLINEDTRDGTYSSASIAAGGPGPLGNGLTAAGFDGSANAVRLPDNLITASTYLSVGLWFRTTAASAGTLLSTGTSPLGTAGPSGAANPILYVGTDGKLHGHFWNGSATGLTSAATVTDGAWHYALLSAAGNTQSLYLDGSQVGSALAGQIQDLDPLTFVGAGVYNNSGWPAAPSGNTWNYFTGQIAEVAYYQHPVTGSVVAQQWLAAHTPATLLSGITQPSGRTEATIAYHTADDNVSQLTDSNGGTWVLGAPVVTGSSQTYAGAVLGSGPQDYWRFGEAGATQAVNQVRGGIATYNAVTLGVPGVFGAGDDTAATLSGSASSIALPGNLFPAGASSQELWFSTTTDGGVLLSSQAGVLGAGTCPCLPVLWIAADGRLRGLSPSTTPSGPLAATGLTNKCVDDAGGATANGTKVGIASCTGGNQQNWTRYPDGTIRDYGKCLEPAGGGTASGTKVDLSDCTGSASQAWQPDSGGLRNPASGRCLDDPGASTTDGTQLQLADCTFGASQLWTQSLVSAAVVNDGNWHHAVITSTGTTQSLYLDGALAQSSTGSVPLAPGAQPFAYLGAGDTGTGASGLTAGTTAYFTGSMDELAAYGSTLSAADVARHWAAYKSAFGVAPVETVRVTDPAASSTTYTFDPQLGNRPLSVTDRRGARTSYGYDVSGFLYTVTDPNGAVTTTGHDIRGNTVSHTACQDQAANNCSTTYYTYYPDDTSAGPPADPRNDMVLTVRDARSSGPTDNRYLTSYGYDAAGNRTTVTTPPVPGFPNGRTTTTVYSGASSHPAADGGYAPAGLVATVTTPGGGAETITYFHNGDPATVVDPAGLSTTYTYDGLGRVLSKKVVSDSYPLGLITSYTYDGQGRPLTVTDPAVTDRVTGATHTARTTTAYDVDGNALTTTVSDLTGGDAARTTTNTYDGAGRLASSTDAAGAATTYGYDAFGHKTSETDPAGATTVYGYDPDGHLLTTTLRGYTGDPANPGAPTDLVESSRAYDPAGRLASITDSMGWITSYTYTDDGLLATITRSDPATGQSFVQQDNTYDAAGNLVSRRTNNRTTTTTYAVDAAGRTASATLDPAGVQRTTSYNYSPDDLVTTTKVSDGSGPGSVTDTSYDPLGRVTAQTVHNDTAGHPVNWWRLADGPASTAAADAAGALPGTVSSSGAAWAAGATFNATNGGVTTSGPVLNTAGDFSISLWVDPAALTSAWQTFAIQQGSTQAGFHLEYDPTSGKWAFSRALTNTTSPAFVHAESSTAAKAGVWTHLVGTYKASTGALTLYVNGASAGTATDTTPFNAGGPLVIGRGFYNGAANNYANAQIANVQAYSRTLSATDVSTLDNLGRAGSALVPAAGWWKLDGSGADSSGAGNAGTASASGVSWSAGLSFNGTTGDVHSAGPMVDTTRDFSVGLWVNLTTAGTAFQSLAVQEAAQQSGFLLEYDGSTGKWSFTRARSDVANASFAHAESTAAAQPGVWTHLVGTYQASTATMTLYVNGTANATNTDTTPIASNGPVALGHSWYNAAAISYASGQIANFQAYDRALSASDVTTLYGYGRTGGALNADRLTTRWSLDQHGLATTRTDPAGNTTSYAYDEAGKLAVSVAPTVNAETGGGTPTAVHPVSMTGYDTFGEPVETSDANGNVTTVGYDAAGRIVSTTLPGYTPPGGTAITAVSTRAYDATGQLTSATDPLGHTTGYGYDQLGDLTNVTDPAGGVTRYTYDTNGDRLSTVDPLGARAEATYDYLGRQLTSTTFVRQPAAAAYTTTRSYGGAAGYLTATTSAGGVVTTYGYNALGEPTTVTDAAGNTTTVRYDYAGRVVAHIRADGTSSTATYDQAGRQVSTADLDATGTTLRTTSVGYDADGRPAATTDPRGNTITFAYDPTGLLAQEVQPVSSSASITTKFGYDAAGNRTRFTDGRGNAFLTTYNAWNLAESTIEPATPAYPAVADRTFTDTYNAAGQVVTETSPGGVVVTNNYDNRGNLTSQTGTGAAAPTAAHNFGYNAAGRIVTASAPGGDDTLTYDDRGLLLTATGPSGDSSFAYNSDGQMARRTDASGTSTYTYDTAGRLATVSDASTGSVLTYGYDVDSRVTSINYGPGAANRAFTYNSLQQLTGDTLTDPSGAVEAAVSYGYDLAGNETSKTTTGFAGATTNTYTYDKANRLTSWNNGTTTTGYAYDASGNRTQVGSKTYTYDARNELTSDGTTTYSYTPRGTLASANGVVSTSDAFNRVIADGSQSYTYDAFDRMLTAPGYAFAYSGAGNDPASDGAATYSRGPDADVIGVGQGGTSRLVLTDQHTDVVGDFTATGTGLTGSAAYDPFGKVTAKAGLLGNLGYQSGWTDPVSTKVNMAARWYNPDAGQFTSRDTVANGPAPNSVAANRFQYGDDNPLTAVDPDGHCNWWDVVCGVQQAAHAVTQAATVVYHAAVNVYHAAVHTVTNVVHQVAAAAVNTWHAVAKTATTVWHSAVSVAKTVVHTVQHYYQAAKKAVVNTWNNAVHTASQVKHAVSDAATKVVKKAVTTYHQVANTVKQVAKTVNKAVVYTVQHPAQAVATAASATGAFLKAHAADIVSFIASTVVFAGCEAVLGAATAGVGAVAGAVACGAAAGAVGGFVSSAMTYAMNTPSSKWNLGDAARTIGMGTLVGGLTGAAGGLLGAVGGKLLTTLGSKVLGPALESLTSRLGPAAVDDVASTMTQDATSDALTATADDAAAAAEPHGGGGTESEPAASEEGSACHSFDGSTPVLMADGSSKPIKEVKLGDKVASTDPKTGKNTAEPVVALHDNHDYDLADVTVQSSDGKTTTLHTTWHHPFWNATSKEWTDAAELKPGTALRVWDGDDYAVKVVSVKTWTGLHEMHDLTVAQIHTYYVLAAGVPLLVHNVNFCGASSTEPSTPELLKSIAQRAEGKIGRAGAAADTMKHAYAAKLLNRYQSAFGDRGLLTEQSWFGGRSVPYTTRGSLRTDVWEPATGKIYDYKFGNTPTPSFYDMFKYITEVPGAKDFRIIRP